MTSTGTIYGYKSVSSTPLDIITELHNDSLVISTTPFSSVFTIGFSTYEETQELNVSLPATVKVVYVDCKQELSAEIAKQNIATVYSKAKRGIVVEGSSKQNIQGEKYETEIFGAGSQYFSLLANKVKLTFK